MDTRARLNERSGIALYRIGALKLLVLGGFSHTSVDVLAVMEKLTGRLQAEGTGCDECAKVKPMLYVYSIVYSIAVYFSI